MKKNKGVVLACMMLIASIIAVAFVGCNQSSNVSKSDPGRQKDKVQIRVMTNDRSRMDLVQKQVDRYNKENKEGVEVVYEVKEDTYEDMLKIAYQAGTAPDIHAGLSGNSSIIAIKNGWLRPIDDELVKEFKEKLVPGSVRSSSIDGKVYNIGINGRGTFKFLWNKDLFKECGLDPDSPPKYWSQVRDYARIITSKGQGKKFGFALPIKDSGLVTLYTMMPGAPSGLYNTNGFDPKTGKYDFSIYKPLVQFFIDLNKDGSLFPTPGTLNNDAARAQFAEGNIGTMFGAYWDVGVFNDQFPAKIDWGIADFPTFDGVKGGYPVSIGSGSFQMNANSKYKDQQLAVWKWLMSEENAKEAQLAGKGMSSYKSLQKPEFMNKDKKGSVEFNTTNGPTHIIDVPNSKASGAVAFEGDNYPLTITRIILNGEDVEKGLADLTRRYNDMLEKQIQQGLVDPSTLVTPGYDPTTYVPD